MFGNTMRTVSHLALGLALAVSASASTDPTYGDLSNGDLPRAALSELKGPDLYPALGAEYRPLVLLDALQTLEQAVQSGRPIPREVQDVLQAHADTWRAAYSNELAGADDFDAALDLVLNEQAEDAPNRVAAFGTVSSELQALSDAAIRYNMAASLSQFAPGDGYRTTTPRPQGTVGLEAEDYRKLQEGYGPHLASQIQLRAREIQEILKS